MAKNWSYILRSTWVVPQNDVFGLASMRFLSIVAITFILRHCILGSWSRTVVVCRLTFTMTTFPFSIPEFRSSNVTYVFVKFNYRCTYIKH